MNSQQGPIAVIGGGWLGQPVAKRLQSLGYTVSVSTRSQQRQQLLQQSGLPCFLLDIEQLPKLPPKELQVETLIINIPSKDMDGFSQLIRLLRQTSVKQVLFISSTSVYKAAAEAATETPHYELEEHPLLTIENMLGHCKDFTTSVIRFAGLVGPGRNPGAFFKSGRVVANAAAPVNLIHLDDCIGIIEALIKKQCWGEVINACADTHPSKRDYYSFAAQQLGRAAPLFSDEITKNAKQISNEKMKQLLGYSLQYPDLYHLPFAHM